MRARWQKLRQWARRANHVVVGAVIAFMGQILVGAVIASPALKMAKALKDTRWALHLLAPLVTDGPKVLCLLLIAYPFGRITAARPVATGVSLVSLVYLFDFGLHYAFGLDPHVWLHWEAILGRSLLAIATGYGVVVLLRRGARTAEAIDAGPRPKDVTDDASAP